MKNPFENIKLSQLYVLCDILADTKVRNVSNIKRKFLERALLFEETLSLLEDLKIAKTKSNEIFPLKDFPNTYNSIDNFKKEFISVLFLSDGYISDLLRNYLLNFQMEKNEIFFKASELEKIKYSDIRNILLELDFLQIGNDNSTYYINPVYFALFFKHFNNKKLSPEIFKSKQAENESIGLTAENSIIEYEIKRLTNITFSINEIEHTSLKNVFAGYDIRSFENYLDNNLKRIFRYIEVKAVSVDDYNFFWSRNEIMIAKVFGESYYLYLLPVVSDNIFDFEKLIMIKNPYQNIYTNTNDWNKLEECVSFSKNINE